MRDNEIGVISTSRAGQRQIGRRTWKRWNVILAQ
jgi:hypothetical protein